MAGPESSATSPSLLEGFLALADDNTVIPPDTMGAAGPAHLMTMLNSQVRIQSKNGADLGTVSLETFWTAGTGLSGDPFDPKLVYDHLSGRWLAVVDANPNSADSQVWFAISDTADPTGTWSFYSFPAHTGGGAKTWADFPALGVNGTWIAITNNMFRVSGFPTFRGAKMWVIDKATALAGGTLTVTVFPTGFDTAGGVDGFTLQPALTFDVSEPKLYIVDNSGWSSGGVFLLRLSEISGTGPSPTWAPVGGGPFPGTGLFFVENDFDFSQIDAAQLGTTKRIETNDPRILAAVFRQARLWTTHTGGLPKGAVDRTAVLWYELDPALLPTTGDPIVQSGVVDGGVDVHHFFPSIAVNGAGEVALGFSRSDPTRHVEAVFTGRAPADPPGSLGVLSVLKPGEDSYEKDFGSGRIRWGDYSATVVDPGNDRTFWTIQEFAALDVGPNANDDRWGTWWGKLSFSAEDTLFVCSSGGGASRLYRVDPATGAATVVGEMGISRCSGLAVRKSTGTLYAVGENPATGTNALFTVNVTTGAATPVGTTGETGIESFDVFAKTSDLAFRPSNEVLYGFVTSIDNMATYDLATGAATLLGPLGSPGA